MKSIILILSVLSLFIAFAFAQSGIEFNTSSSVVRGDVNFLGEVSKQGVPIVAGDVSAAGNNNFSGTNSFTNALATTTFAGPIDIGLQYVRNYCGTGAITCIATCPAPKKVIGGGCEHYVGGGMYVVTSYPNTTSSWYCSFSNYGDAYSDAVCANIK